jgi:hypothetical protein
METYGLKRCWWQPMALLQPGGGLAIPLEPSGTSLPVSGGDIKGL